MQDQGSLSVGILEYSFLERQVDAKKRLSVFRTCVCACAPWVSLLHIYGVKCNASPMRQTPWHTDIRTKKGFQWKKRKIYIYAFGSFTAKRNVTSVAGFLFSFNRFGSKRKRIKPRRRNSVFRCCLSMSRPHLHNGTKKERLLCCCRSFRRLLIHSFYAQMTFGHCCSTMPISCFAEIQQKSGVPWGNAILHVWQNCILLLFVRMRSHKKQPFRVQLAARITRIYFCQSNGYQSGFSIQAFFCELACHFFFCRAVELTNPVFGSLTAAFKTISFLPASDLLWLIVHMHFFAVFACISL